MNDDLANLNDEQLAAQALLLAAELARRATTRTQAPGPSNGLQTVDPNRLLTADEAAERFGVNVAWVRRNGRRHGLAVNLSPGTVRYPVAALDEFVRRQRRRAR